MKPLTIEMVISSPSFPTPPAIAVKIMALVQDPEVSLHALTVAISEDGALAAKLLKQANSSFYARSRAVSRLSDAVMVLGLRRVKTLALGFSLVDNRRGKDGAFDHTRFWRRSLFAGLSARDIGIRTPGVDEDEAFLGGLMHSLGALALNQAAGAEYQELFAQARGDYSKLLELESAAWGFNHAELGGRLGDLWNLPRELTAALRWFPTPELSEDALRPLVSCVSVAAAAADLFICESPGPALLRYRERCERLFQLHSEESDQLLTRVQLDAAATQSLLDLPEDETIDIVQILSLASSAMGEMSLEAERRIVELEHENIDLVIQAYTDSQTGLANHRRLLQFMADAVDAAIQRHAPLCYLMVDIDHFKHINDVHGHLVGDIVLKNLAETLVTATRGTDLVARYGGEEFGIVTPDTDLIGAVQLAQRLRRTVESVRFDVLAAGQLKITVSIGVATLDSSWLSPVPQLIGAADEAMYEAKESGRNVVRINRRARPAA